MHNIYKRRIKLEIALFFICVFIFKYTHSCSEWKRYGQSDLPSTFISLRCYVSSIQTKYCNYMAYYCHFMAFDASPTQKIQITWNNRWVVCHLCTKNTGLILQKKKSKSIFLTNAPKRSCFFFYLSDCQIVPIYMV